jgi:hypothetical protein
MQANSLHSKNSISYRVHETVQYLYIKRPQRRFFQQSAYCVSSRLEISRGTNRSSSVLSIINSATLFFFFFLIRNTSAANEWIERAALSQFSQWKCYKQFKWIWDADLLVDLFSLRPNCVDCFATRQGTRWKIHDENWIKILVVKFQSLDVVCGESFIRFENKMIGAMQISKCWSSITGQHNENLQCREIVFVECVLLSLNYRAVIRQR